MGCLDADNLPRRMPPRPVAAELWGALLAEWDLRLQRLNRARTTRKNYLWAARRFLRTYPDVAFDIMTPEHIERHLYALRLSPRTFCTELERLRAFFRWLRDHQRLVRNNPCDRVEKPAWKARRRPAPSVNDFLAVCRCCRTLEEAVLVELLYFSGPRLSEVRLLHVGQINLEHRRIYLVGKGDEEGMLVFPARTRRLLQLYLFRYIRLSSEMYVFGSPVHPRRPRGHSWMERTVKRLGVDARLPYKLTPHVLRHGFARLLKTRKVPVHYAMKLLRHRDIQTTIRVYGQLSDDDIQQVYDEHLKEFS